MSRVVAIPLLGLSWNSPCFRSALFIGAAATDWLDGFLARRMNLSSRFGAFLDPVADKLMVATALVLRGVLPGTCQSSYGELPKIGTVSIGHDPATTESYQ